MFFRFAIDEQPKREPGETERSGENESPAPAKLRGDPRNDERRDDGTNVCAGVEYAGGERTLFLWEPFGNAFEACGKNSGFAEAQTKARYGETKKRVSDGVPHGGEAPEDHGDRIADACA